MVRVPIIVVLYRMREMEMACLSQVKNHTNPDHYELHVRDNGEEDRNLASLWNEMIEPLESEWFCLLNTDCLVTPGWLEKMQPAMSIEKAGFVGPMTDACGSLQKVGPEYRPDRHEGQVALQHHLSGFCLLVRKQAWEDAGRFDESSPFYGQESLLIERAWRKGWVTVMCLDTFVTHLGGATAREIFGSSWDEEKRKGGDWFQSKLAELRRERG
tara:strand:+ start:3287 stop:3928 length:642 start_codon:yes stop_codon:yes gene_type:complete